MPEPTSLEHVSRAVEEVALEVACLKARASEDDDYDEAVWDKLRRSRVALREARARHEQRRSRPTLRLIQGGGDDA